jgi:hypothetical protein
MVAKKTTPNVSAAKSRMAAASTADGPNVSVSGHTCT